MPVSWGQTRESEALWDGRKEGARAQGKAAKPRAEGGAYAVTLEDGGERIVEIGLMTDSVTQIVAGLSEGETAIY